MKIIFYLVVSLTFISCSGNKSKEASDTIKKSKEPANTIILNAAQIKNGGIDTGKLEKHLIASNIHVSGQVDVPPENLISVNVPMGGFLSHSTMIPGQKVSKGEVIAIVQNQDYVTLQQDYLTTISKIAFLKQEVERQKLLSQQQASPLKIYQQSVADYNAQLAQAAGLAQKLRMIGINPSRLSTKNISSTIAVRSPINGIVSKVNIGVGKFVNPTDVFMELVNTNDIHAAFTVFEKDINTIGIGNRVKILVPSVPGKIYPGKVILIGKVLDTARSVLVHCHFLKTDNSLLPNMYIQGEIEAKPKLTMAVPDGALVNYNSGQYIYVAEPSKNNVRFALLPVTVGAKSNGFNEINLSKPELMGKTFVLKGAFSILSAMKNKGEDD